MNFKVMCFGTLETGQLTFLFFFFFLAQPEHLEGILNLLIFIFQKSHFLPLFLEFLHDYLEAVMFCNFGTTSWLIWESGVLSTFVARLFVEMALLNTVIGHIFSHDSEPTTLNTWL